MAVDRADGPSNVKDGPPRPLRKKCGRQRAVSEALIEVHARQLLPRDIKSNNIMAPPEGRKPHTTSDIDFL